MIYPENFEDKIGFDRIRGQIKMLCITSGAVEKLAHTSFLTDRTAIVALLEETFEMRTILMMESHFPDPSFVDTHTFLRKIELGGTLLELEEIIALHKALVSVYELVRFFAQKSQQEYPRLKSLSNDVESFPEIINHIDSILDKYGRIKDNASSELYAIRKSIREREGQISRRLQQILSQAQASGVVDNDASLSIREGRAVIPVSAANKRKIKGLVHDESATGKTFYVEPIEVVELNNELKELEYTERREILRILVHFADLIRPDLPGIISSGEYLYDMDLIRAKARYALENDCTLPIIENESSIQLTRGCHPLLAQTLKREHKKIVPLNLTLTPEKHILVISGPNAGGKSVCLKTVGLLQYMLQCGFLIPCSENSEMGIFNHIFIDIGDEQSIDNDLSTYSSHLLNMKNILRHADDRSLILIDEFGTGTEPMIGGAIAESVLEKLEQKRCFGVITTHYSNLKYYATNARGISNGAMTFDVQNIRPLFELEIGHPGSSFAVEIARKIGLPEEIIRSASEKAGSDHINIERQLREIARDRRYWEHKRDKIHQTEKRVDEVAQRYEQELEGIKSERNQLLKAAKTEALRITSEANKQIENTIREIRESQAEKQRTLIVRRKIEDFKSSLEAHNADSSAIDRKIAQLQERQQRREERKKERTAEAAQPKPTKKDQVKPQVLAIGVKVRILGQDTLGEVMSLQGKKATVAFGQILTQVDLQRLETISNSEFKKVTRQFRQPAAKTNFDTAQRSTNFSPQINVRGMRVHEALEQVEAFVDDAIMLGMSDLSILHGKGTGALKEEIRKYLKTIPLVKSAKDEHEELGGAGITVVKLEL